MTAEGGGAFAPPLTRSSTRTIGSQAIKAATSIVEESLGPVVATAWDLEDI